MEGRQRQEECIENDLTRTKSMYKQIVTDQ
jgi:hypothetical protein